MMFSANDQSPSAAFAQSICYRGVFEKFVASTKARPTLDFKPLVVTDWTFNSLSARVCPHPLDKMVSPRNYHQFYPRGATMLIVEGVITATPSGNNAQFSHFIILVTVSVTDSATPLKKYLLVMEACLSGHMDYEWKIVELSKIPN
jgi:hypothetical protein